MDGERQAVADYLKEQLWPEPPGVRPHSEGMRAEILARCQELATGILALLGRE